MLKGVSVIPRTATTPLNANGIENKKGCFSAVFISKCVKEIEDILTLEENTTENKEQ